MEILKIKDWLKAKHLQHLQKLWDKAVEEKTPVGDYYIWLKLFQPLFDSIEKTKRTEWLRDQRQKKSYHNITTDGWSEDIIINLSSFVVLNGIQKITYK